MINDPAVKRHQFELQIFERDGWECLNPACNSKRDLKIYHKPINSNDWDSRNWFTLCKKCGSNRALGFLKDDFFKHNSAEKKPTGDELKSQGIQLSVFGADNKSPDWSDRAFEQLLYFIRTFPGKPFQSSNVRDFAYKNGLPRLDEQRSWGGVFTRAANKKIIKRIGYTNSIDPKSHSCPTSLWIPI